MKRALPLVLAPIFLFNCADADVGHDDPTPAPAASLEEALSTAGADLVVDDDGVQCPNADFSGIQAAVDAADEGDTIFVCPGTYAESTIVEKTLKLLGAQHGRDARSRTLNPAKESIIHAGERLFRLRANDIVFDGFMVRVVLGDDGEGVGIGTSQDHSGYRIVNNAMDADGTTALWAGNSGEHRMVIRRNLFTSRLGIAAENDEGSEAHNLLIEDNLFVDSSIAFIGNAHSDLVIRDNKLVGGSISVADNVFGPGDPPTHDVQIIRNKIFNSPDVALSFRNVRDILVRDNMLRDGTGDAVSMVAGSENLRFKGNRIAGFAGAGFRVGYDQDVGNIPQEITTGVIIEKNEVEDSGAGIVTYAAEGNIIRRNNVEDNAGVGLDLGADSSSNTISENESRGNGLDCQDASSGEETLGTANTWTDNEGSTSNPAGLCAD